MRMTGSHQPSFRGFVVSWFDWFREQQMTATAYATVLALARDYDAYDKQKSKLDVVFCLYRQGTVLYSTVRLCTGTQKMMRAASLTALMNWMECRCGGEVAVRASRIIKSMSDIKSHQTCSYLDMSHQPERGKYSIIPRRYCREQSPSCWG